MPISFVCGANKGVDMRIEEIVIELVQVKSQTEKSPWLLAGNFNVVKSMQEKWDCDQLNSYIVLSLS